jgi:hypothetical protein
MWRGGCSSWCGVTWCVVWCGVRCVCIFLCCLGVVSVCMCVSEGVCVLCCELSSIFSLSLSLSLSLSAAVPSVYCVECFCVWYVVCVCVCVCVRARVCAIHCVLCLCVCVLCMCAAFPNSRAGLRPPLYARMRVCGCGAGGGSRSISYPWIVYRACITCHGVAGVHCRHTHNAHKLNTHTQRERRSPRTRICWSSRVCKRSW